jgi:uncharacterized protein YndB with AHSA1/START domain
MTTPTKSETAQVYRVYIKTTPQAVWEAITKPEWTERYGYRTRSEFSPGVQAGASFRGLSNQGMLDMGAPEVAVDGEVIEADPPRKLVHTFRMAMDPETAAEGFTRVTYDIVEIEGLCKVTVTHEVGGAPRMADIVSGGMEERIGTAGGGWSMVLSDLKSLLETGKALRE